MSEFTKTKFEDALSGAENFLYQERGESIDGAYAGTRVQEQINTVASRAEALLTSVPYPNQDGYYIPLSKHNKNQYNEAIQVLPGHMVLVPSGLVGSAENCFYPAVVSEDSRKNNTLRLHVLRQKYGQSGIGYGSGMILSASGQSETKGVGEHGKKPNDGLEAEHFASLLAAGGNKSVYSAWQKGQHINHTWRRQSNSSVTTEVFRTLFGSDVSQETINITSEQIATGKALILWHEALRDQDSGKPESATKDKALVIVQALGYQALKDKNPDGLDNVRRLIS